MVLSIYSGKNEVSLFSESLVCDEEQLVLYHKGKEGTIKNEGGRESVLPKELAINSSLRLLNRDEKLDSRIKSFVEFLKNSASFEMLSPSEMQPCF